MKDKFYEYKKTAKEILDEDGYISAIIYANDLRRGKNINKEEWRKIHLYIIDEYGKLIDRINRSKLK